MEEVKVLSRLRSFQLEESPQLINYRSSSLINAPVHSSILTPEFISHIGLNRERDLSKDSAYGYMTINHVNTSLKDDENTAFMVTEQLNSLFSFLWFIKDCSSHLYETILFSPDSDYSEIIANHEVYSNTSGKKSISIFTKKEIEIAFNIRNSYLQNIQKGGEVYRMEADLSLMEIYKDKLNFRPYNDMSRIQRAMTFLNFARKENFIPFKISMYVPIYESLFADYEPEISHKIGERCAYYIGGNKDEKIFNYKTITEAYNIRSRILHGDELKEKKNIYGNHNVKESQIQICKDIDALTRKVLTKVITEDYEEFFSENIKEFYARLIFN